MNAAAWRGVSLALYVLAVGSLLAIGLALGSNATAGGDEIDVLNRTLASLKSRAPNDSAAPGASAEPAFFEGASLTLAQAALQKRVIAAADKAGATVASAQIESVEGAESPRQIRVAASLDLDPAKIQFLLYDLEAGAPEVIVRSFSASVEKGDDSKGARAHVAIAVDSMWRPQP